MKKSRVLFLIGIAISAALGFVGCSAASGEAYQPTDGPSGDGSTRDGSTALDGNFVVDGGVSDAPPDVQEDAGPPPRLSAFFCVPPGDGGSDPTLENKVIELLAHATIGSEVRVSMYHFTRVNVAQAFVDASRRGVHVSIILDDQQNGGDGGE
ncbi:MAG: phospholipase D-like domain-containing protein, partial [Polyangiaceae bacterium]